MASGDTLVIGDVSGGHNPASNFATPTTLPGTLILAEAFDDATDETKYYKLLMVGQYDDTSALDVAFEWKFATHGGGSQTVDWEVSFYRMLSDTDTWETYSFATAQTSIETEASATGEMKQSVINFTNAEADGIQSNEWFILRFVRDASGGTQGSPGDAELGGFEVRYA